MALRTWLLLTCLAASGCWQAESPAFVGPGDDRSDDGADEGLTRVSVMREIVWANPGRTIRISWGSRVCQKTGLHESCIRLSAADRRQLHEVFGADEFRSRWAAYRACPATIRAGDGEIFAVTYADGEQIGKRLDAPLGAPETRRCDREIRSAIVDVEDELVRRYLR